MQIMETYANCANCRTYASYPPAVSMFWRPVLDIYIIRPWGNQHFGFTTGLYELSNRLESHVIVHVRNVGVRKSSLALCSVCVLILRSWFCGGDGDGGGGGGGGAGGEVQHQVAPLGPIEVQRLCAFFTTTRTLPPAHQELERLSCRRGLRHTGGLREDAMGESNGAVGDDGGAALQWVPAGGSGGGGGGSGVRRGELPQREPSSRDFTAQRQLRGFGETHRTGPLLGGGATSWKRDREEGEGDKRVFSNRS